MLLFSLYGGWVTGIEWPSFLPAALLVSLVPGANQILSIQHGARHGVSSAMRGLIGRFSAFGVHVALVAVGLSAVLVRSAPAFEALRWLGVAYLAYLAITAFRSSGQLREREGSGTAPVRREFVTALTNPKALLLFAAFVPQFVTIHDASHLAVAGVAYVGVEAITATAYIILGQRLGHLLHNANARRRLDRTSGIAYAGLAGWLAFERRP